MVIFDIFTDTRESDVAEFEPLLSAHPSETYMNINATKKDYKTYQNAETYRWQAPELFVPDEEGLVHPCSKSDVYSLCLVLWESCNGKYNIMLFYVYKVAGRLV